VQEIQNQLNVIARGLNSVSPLATLDRGYAIVTDSETGSILHDARKVEAGARVSARLASGSIDATVTKVKQDSNA
jgi:exodeoxyribonuclease VII large subunit